MLGLAPQKALTGWTIGTPVPYPMPQQCTGADLSLAAEAWLEKGEGLPSHVLGTVRAAAREPIRKTRILLDPNVRLLKERGLLGVPSPQDTLGKSQGAQDPPSLTHS